MVGVARVRGSQACRVLTSSEIKCHSLRSDRTDRKDSPASFATSCVLKLCRNEK